MTMRKTHNKRQVERGMWLAWAISLSQVSQQCSVFLLSNWALHFHVWSSYNTECSANSTFNQPVSTQSEKQPLVSCSTHQKSWICPFSNNRIAGFLLRRAGRKRQSKESNEKIFSCLRCLKQLINTCKFQFKVLQNKSVYLRDMLKTLSQSDFSVLGGGKKGDRYFLST